MSEQLQTATFAGGCFWCTEAIFKRLTGVISVLPGYAGGQRPHPTYEQIHSGVSGHAESIQIQFDPKVIDYPTLLEVFFATHDPTTKDRQGYDEGSEYRSIIFYHDEEQKNQALAAIKKLEQSKAYREPIVTEIVPFTTFFQAEAEHLDFYAKNRTVPYCRIIIDPKIQKLLKHFTKIVKKEYK
ncbi:MAG TPA: peptide-methionine (S)-S-oxide reductase MsrA [Patescibacteria group bacterium]